MKVTLILCLIVVLHWNGNAQPPIKEKQEIVYKITPKDSIIKTRREYTYDTLGRLMNRHSYTYHSNSGVLRKEKKANFDTASNILTEFIIDYPQKGAPRKQKLVTKYLVYAPKEKNSKYVWRQLYDKYGEMVKEDTLTYNQDSLLTERCTYDYRGNTSLSCDTHKYNKKGERVRWRSYRKWTTINGRGEVADRQRKRRDYKYRYNRDGKLKRAWGKYYKTKFCQKVKYNKAGQKRLDKTVVKRRLKKSGAKRYYIRKDIHQITYDNGRKIEEIKTIGGEEKLKITISYQDTLVKKYEKYLKEKLSLSIAYEYDENHKKIKKTEKRHNSNGVYRYSIITTYNDKENPIEEKQIMGGRVYSTLKKHYNSYQQLIQQSFSIRNNQNFEKTLYIYKYY